MNEALRIAIAQAGETAESLALRVNVDPKTVGRWVSEDRIPHPRSRAAVAKALGRDPAEFWPAPFRRRTGWFRPWQQIEAQATALRSYQPLAVPGLLQTEEYAREMLRVGAVHTPDEVEAILADRLARQSILARDRPPYLVAVMDEVVLRRLLGDRTVMRDQALHLIEIARRHPHVQIRVIPSTVPWHTGLSGSFVLARLADATELAYVDGQLRGDIYADPADIATLGRRWDSICGESLTRQASLDLIEEVARTWS
ncbi:Scr1 family TA system antitoxin-like transcriptional regulator [Solwaraspora sp. WMMD1047]|uniref:helix-turn-helix domain-containing protein n=1 Tax=Solwaraspora sp. WMMD1047 TaxID=3016102 RepID=UPI002417C072|nr:Scr1 family TA system antitoxin-like transcriptional regulator [Solwaraspora sp. WMMD1047]MDG4833100.1 Scr1 family TA system antitoxin-like transcriptional regulator [Solwaraspora sp. WMMD1047]